jgi:hypothetical protein
VSLADDLRAFLDQEGRAAVDDIDELAAWLIRRGVGKRGGRRRSRRERPECPELGAASKRFARALAARAAEGDTEGLEQLVEVRQLVDEAIVEAARGLNRFGYSWTHVGDVLGISRQAARQRFGEGV